MFGLLLATPAAAEEISDFSADIEINQDASVSITEEIRYDFEDAERHGIFRDIPVSYKTNTGNRRIFIEVVEVLQDGEPAQTKESREGDNLRIRIGDLDETITGVHTYEITYNVRGALNYFEDDSTAELYWDVVGDGWEVPIRSASASVFLSEREDADTEDITTRCFAGPVGSNASCRNLSETVEPLGLTALAEDIRSGEAMTVVLNFPANLVSQPSALASWWWFIQANPLVLLPLIVFFISFFVWYRWGKDPKGRGVVVTQYEPPQNLKPILVGSLIDETVHGRDITAGILWLAQQGYIEIERTEEKSFILSDHDYILRKNRSFEDIDDRTYRHLAETIFANTSKGIGRQFTSDLIQRTVPPLVIIVWLIVAVAFGFPLIGAISDWWFAPYILAGIAILIAWAVGWWYKNKYDGSFTINVLGEREDESDDVDQRPAVYISELAQSQTYQKAIRKMKKDVMQDMRDRGWFAEENKLITKSLWALAVIGFVILEFGNFLDFGVVESISIFAAATIMIGFRMLMKRKTKEGAILQEDLEGFKLFLSMTQKERLDFHNAPKRRPKEFMEYLPYAIALEVEEKWAEQFRDIDMPPPAWYRGAGGFAAASLADDLGTFSDNYSQAAGGGSGASGGGSAGGGMGGGGGGSW